MSLSPNTPPILVRYSDWTLPSKSICYIEVPNAMPCITILVHGVNDVGEFYGPAEAGLCAGLSQRLDLAGCYYPAFYTDPDNTKVALDKAYIEQGPEKIYWKRQVKSLAVGPDPDATVSPVIPFYWGSREREGKDKNGKANIIRTHAHGEWTDRDGNRLDKDGAKGGGPFANATTSLPDMFNLGFERNLWVFLAETFISNDPTRPLRPAIERRYMVLAAARLAALIRAIRRRSPHETVNLVAHSQGCMVSLLAQAILHDEKLAQDRYRARNMPHWQPLTLDEVRVLLDGYKLGVDNLIMNNPPYSLEQLFLEKFQGGLANLDSDQRLAQLRNIVRSIVDAPASTPDFAGLQKEMCDAMVGSGWRPTAKQERDNRGKVYLYFSPDDHTVGLKNVQGIGWQGIGRSAAERLGPRFYQRVFTMRQRNGQPQAVGSAGLSCGRHRRGMASSHAGGFMQAKQGFRNTASIPSEVPGRLYLQRRPSI